MQEVAWGRIQLDTFLGEDDVFVGTLHCVCTCYQKI